MMFIDSHAHLEGKRYDADRDEVLARAKQNGIEAYLAIGNGDGPDTADCGIRLAEKYDGRAGISANLGERGNSSARSQPCERSRGRSNARMGAAIRR